MKSMRKRHPDLVRFAAALAVAAAVMAVPLLGFAQTAQEQRQDQLNRDVDSKRLQRSQDAREQQLQNQNEQRLQQQQRQIEQRNQMRSDRDARRARDANDPGRRQP
jgi:uncharacterized protein HemX